MKKVSVITVNYNHHMVTEALLDSISEKNTYKPIEIIVVDNGSRVNMLSSWEKKYPHVRFVRSDTNLGFAGGNNLGIKRATGEYYFFINNDTEITEGLIEKLAATLDSSENIGMVSPKIRYFDEPGMLQYAGFTPMNYYTARNKCIGQFETDNGQYDLLTGETGFIHGAAMMVRREAIMKAGKMPENYFLYYEEMDWCDHIRKAGFKIWVNMQAVVYHKESVSVGPQSALKEYFMNRNRILFTRRNAPFFARLVFWPYFVAVVASRNMLGYLIKGQWNFAKALIQAIAWNLTNNSNSTNLGYPINDTK